MAITNITIYQDNIVNNSNLVPVHSPAIFLIDVTYTDTAPTSLHVDIIESGVLLGTYRAIPLEDLTSTLRRFMFISNEICKALMEGYEDQLQTTGSIILVEGITKLVSLRFFDPVNSAVNDSVDIALIHGASQFGEYPNKDKVFNNEADTYYALKDTPVYVYFYNDDEDNVISITGAEPEDLFDITFVIRDESLNPLYSAQIEAISVPIGQAPFTVTTPIDSGTVIKTDIWPGVYQFRVTKTGYITQIVNATIASDQTVTITMVANPPDYLELIPTSINIGNDLGNTVQFAVSSNIPWTINTSALTYFSLDKTSGTGNDVVTATAISANTGYQRSQQFHLLGGTFDITGTIIQEAVDAILTVSPSIIHIGSEVGNQVQFAITSNIPWTINTSGLTFASVDDDSGTGNQTITLTVTAKNTTGVRSQTVYVVGGIYNIPITIVQAGTSDYLNVTPGLLIMPKSIGSQKQLYIDTNLPWSISVTGSTIFATLSQVSGTGPATITATVFLENNTGGPRGETLTITASWLSKIIGLIQSPSDIPTP